MSSLIEQAAKRLQELRRAGIDIPVVRGFSDSRLLHEEFADTVPLHPPVREPAVAEAEFEAEAESEVEVVAEVEAEAYLAARIEAEPELDLEPDVGPGSASSVDETPAPEPMPRQVEAANEPSSDVVVVVEPARHAPPRRRLDIDLARLAAAGYLVPAQAQSLLADLLRVIKRPLLQNMVRTPELGGPARRGNVVVVTSAVSGEGKTFVALNLAMSVAMEVDHAALLIDGDVLRPSIFGRLGLQPQSGLMDLLLNRKLKARDLLVETNVPKLSLLAAGTAQDRAEELLASAAMDRLLDELSVRFHDRMIIIDSPPLLVTTESRALAERAGQVVLVVEADRTPRDEVMRAMETLDNCHVVLPVLNKSRAIESDYVYGY